MDVISRQQPHQPHQQSSLNPNAPMFVPSAYRMVEDFSTEWWALVQSSPWFRDYWLQENFQDPQNDPFFDDSDFIDDLFDEHHYRNTTSADHNTNTQQVVGEEAEKDYHRELVSLGLLKWPKGRAVAKAPRFIEKAPKIVNVKVSPRPIQQPR